MTMFKSAPVLLVLALSVIGVFSARLAQAQSICDLVPGPEVQSALNLPTTLVAVPDTEWGNGCDYSAVAGQNPVVEILVAGDAGMDNISLNNHTAATNDANQHVPDIGDAAIYFDNAGTPTADRRQNLIFRKGHKIVDFVVIGADVPESAILSLGRLIAGKPIETLKDPAN